MKKSKIALILVAALILSFAFASCSKTETVVNLKFVVNDSVLIDVPVTMNSESPKVLDVVTEAMVAYADSIGEMIVLDDEGTGIKTVKDLDIEYTTGYNAETKIISGWEFYINDEKEVRVGLADDVAVANGDTIKYSFYSYEYTA